METKVMLEKIMERLEAISEENTKLISKVEAIQAKLEEMSRGQLVAIVEQGERFMRELKRSNTVTEAAIHAEALKDTVSIDKKELQEMLDNAFGGNEEVKAHITKELEELAEGIGKNFKILNNNMERAFKVTFENELTHFAKLKELILDTEKEVRGVGYKVDSMPNVERGLI